MGLRGNVTFAALAQDVDRALENYRDCEQDVKDREGELNRAKVDLSNARIALEKARDAMFEAHPELRPQAVSVPVPVGDVEEQDDPDDFPGRMEFRETAGP